MNRKKQTFLVFVKLGEKSCSTDSIQTISKTRYLNSSKRKKIAMNRNEKLS